MRVRVRLATLPVNGPRDVSNGVRGDALRKFFSPDLALREDISERRRRFLAIFSKIVGMDGLSNVERREAAEVGERRRLDRTEALRLADKMR